jgi:glycosyltransferase involved in cell wall biosynthesis
VARADLDAILVPPGDAHALASSLRRVLHDPQLRQGLVDSGSDRAESFSMAQLAQRYEGLYEQVLRRR